MGVRVRQQPSPHCAPRTKRITAIVLHYSGSMELNTTADWMCTPEAHYSVHYLVGRNGDLVQLVKDDCVAYHAGRSAMYPEAANEKKEPHVDLFSIGIELIGTADSGFTDRQLASLDGLLERLIHTYDILPDRIVGHAHIAPGRKLDPDGFDRQFNWQRLREMAESAYRARQATKVRPSAL